MTSPRAAILSIGDELLLGLTVDTNAAWLCRQAGELGWTVTGIRTVGDVTADIVAALQAAVRGAELVLVTGGLGPTEDDRTREALARALGVPLEEREELVRQIEERFRQIQRPMRPVNRVQAQVPRGAQGIRKTCGTAPGIAAELGQARVFVMPGVPREMRVMFTDAIRPEIQLPATARVRRMREIHLFGIGESNVGEAIRDWMRESRNPTVGTTVHEGTITVRALAEGATAAEADALLAAVEADVRARLGEHVFGCDETTLAGAVVARLTARQETLALAESCTGGMIAAAVVDVPGASAVLREGVVAYANDAKTRRLDVPAAVLAAHGAVSPEVACAMARGARATSGATYALATTGIAGPTGGTKEKPVGTVCLALATPSRVCYTTRRFAGDRYDNRVRATHVALDLLRRELAGLPQAGDVELEQR